MGKQIEAPAGPFVSAVEKRKQRAAEAEKEAKKADKPAKEPHASNDKAGE